jgi:hypothetical protein
MDTATKQKAIMTSAQLTIFPKIFFVMLGGVLFVTIVVPCLAGFLNDANMAANVSGNDVQRTLIHKECIMLYQAVVQRF